MGVQGWAIIATLFAALGVTLGPWLFFVHAKLAVMAVEIKGMKEAFEKLSASNEERVPRCSDHREQLGALDVRVAALERRIDGLTKE